MYIDSVLAHLNTYLNIIHCPLNMLILHYGVSLSTMDEGWKGIILRGEGAYLRCPVSTSVHFSLRNEGSSVYIRLCE